MNANTISAFKVSIYLRHSRSFAVHCVEHSYQFVSVIFRGFFRGKWLIFFFALFAALRETLFDSGLSGFRISSVNLSDGEFPNAIWLFHHVLCWIFH